MADSQPLSSSSQAEASQEEVDSQDVAVAGDGEHNEEPAEGASDDEVESAPVKASKATKSKPVKRKSIAGEETPKRRKTRSARN